MKQIFKHFGFRYVIANNGLEGYKAFTQEKHEFDVVITDLRMPVMSGQEMISKIRKQEEKMGKNIKVPIIVTTGESGEMERNRCINILGANNFINKPIKFENLYATLSLLLLTGPRAKIRGLEEVKEEEKIMGSSDSSYEEDIPRNLMKSKTLMKRILVIEDNKFLNSILTQFIQSSDFLVDQCYSKAEVIYIYIYILIW